MKISRKNPLSAVPVPPPVCSSPTGTVGENNTIPRDALTAIDTGWKVRPLTSGENAEYPSRGQGENSSSGLHGAVLITSPLPTTRRRGENCSIGEKVPSGGIVTIPSGGQSHLPQSLGGESARPCGVEIPASVSKITTARCLSRSQEGPGACTPTAPGLPPFNPNDPSDYLYDAFKEEQFDE